MHKDTFEWRDIDGDLGFIDPDGTEINLVLKDSDGNEAIHYLASETVSKLAFHAMRLASPVLPSAGEFWIVEVAGVRRVVQIEDTATAETLREDVQFIARIPVEAQ